MEEKYTLRDLASGRFTFKQPSDIGSVEDVRSVVTKVNENGVSVVIHVGLFNYVVNDNLVKALQSKIKTDLPSLKYRFTI